MARPSSRDGAEESPGETRRRVARPPRLADEVDAAMKWLCPPGRDRVTLRELRDKLSIFYPSMPLSELRFLMGDAKEVTVAEVRALLAEGPALAGGGDFDPVAEAFEVFDGGKHAGGAVDVATMTSIFERLGFGQLSREDVEVLVKTADLDGDGIISLADFRGLSAAAAASASPRGASESGGGMSSAREADDGGFRDDERGAASATSSPRPLRREGQANAATPATPVAAASPAGKLGGGATAGSGARGGAR